MQRRKLEIKAGGDVSNVSYRQTARRFCPVPSSGPAVLLVLVSAPAWVLALVWILATLALAWVLALVPALALAGALGTA